MITWTHNNHVQIFYNQDVNQTHRRCFFDKAYANFGTVERKTYDYRTEALRVAQLMHDVAENERKKVVVLYSGGDDSEVVMCAFMAAGIPFTPLIIRFTNGSNSHDTNYAFEFCARYNLKPEVYDIDQFWLESQEAYDLGVMSQAVAIQSTVISKVQREVSEYTVLGNGDMFFFKKNNDADSPWVYKFSEHMISHYKFAATLPWSCGTAFFKHTPEMMMAFLQHKVIDDVCNNRIPGIIMSRSSKGLVFRDAFPEMGPRRPKYTGFESWDHEWLDHLNDSLEVVNKHSVLQGVSMSREQLMEKLWYRD